VVVLMPTHHGPLRCEPAVPRFKYFLSILRKILVEKCQSSLAVNPFSKRRDTSKNFTKSKRIPKTAL
jgi:hypothetical protein